MPENIRSDPKTQCTCPVCRLIDACRDSEAAGHVRTIGHEAVALGRCLVQGALRIAQERLSSTPPEK